MFSVCWFLFLMSKGILVNVGTEMEISFLGRDLPVHSPFHELVLILYPLLHIR